MNDVELYIMSCYTKISATCKVSKKNLLHKITLGLLGEPFFFLRDPRFEFTKVISVESQFY